MKKENITGSKVWIIEDDRALGTLLKEEVIDSGLEAIWMSSAEEALMAMQKDLPDLFVCDLKLPQMDGLTFLSKVKQTVEGIAPGFLIITAFGTIPKAVEALRAGADDFLTKPLDLEHFILCVNRIIESKKLKEVVSRMRGLFSSDIFHGMYGKSTPMRLLFDQIKQVAKARGPVLIVGESGSGKELVAKAIHEESEREGNVFLPVNCAGIPEHLLESEFFGHAEGSFTGANRGRQGLFAEAQDGTLLLDEIAEMPLALQAKLLRILQDGKIRRIGENREHQVNVRVLAATHGDLEEEVKKSRFREDLFYRLETFTLRVPPLRERGDDVELLAAKFLQQFSLALDKKVTDFSPQALDLITNYSFPGNVRELRNAVERGVTFATTNRIQVDNLPARIRDFASSNENINCSEFAFKKNDNRFLTLAQMEQRYIYHVLESVNGNKRRAAAILDIGRRTLYRKCDGEI
ncbi:sigma-54 dependent transcriptional regulator [Chitinispirillales bacterium ANBcel5]|uniref:sigma-54-dependent transcriptional regulator n=1 Tax=Cellulosispirillum alkaliphilum TaxID=3039283 RepID=UPI002A52C949|nr:sigma-54 dependent transcriptional regulator [Chitinispirillales bacterium ANBcel5]